MVHRLGNLSEVNCRCTAAQNDRFFSGGHSLYILGLLQRLHWAYQLLQRIPALYYRVVAKPILHEIR